ncbi:MAG TPA: GNAT family N-acetyltransferase [Solirubrobacteraceae bacterium]
MGFARPVQLKREHDVEGFACGEQALNDWLLKHALDSHASGGARVYVALADDGRVAGYYAVTAAQVEPSEAVPRAMKGQPGHRPVPAILLARLAVDLAFQGQGLGVGLLNDALLRSLTVAEEIGIRVVLVHAQNDRAKTFYEQYGFEESPTDRKHLMVLVKDVRRTLDAA